MSPLEPTPHERLRHELRTPLTVVHGSAQLLARLLARAEGLRPDERTRLENRLADLETAAAELRDRIEALTERPERAQRGHVRATRDTLARTQAQIDASWDLLRRAHQGRCGPPDT